MGWELGILLTISKSLLHKLTVSLTLKNCALMQTSRLPIALASSEIQPKYFARHFRDEQRACPFGVLVARDLSEYEIYMTLLRQNKSLTRPLNVEEKIHPRGYITRDNQWELI